MAENNTRSFVVDIIDERDELVGYGVCVYAERRREFRMRAPVYATRSEAHAATDPISIALNYYRQNTGPITRGEMEAAASKRRNFHTLAELNALEFAGIEVRS
jgi:hypothetical protein